MSWRSDYDLGVRRMEWGSGSVFLRGKKWVAQVSIGSPPHRRYRRRSAVQAGKPNTRRGAIAALEELRAELRIGLNPSAQSLGDYLQRWLAETARPMITSSSFKAYRQAIAHLEPIFGVRLRDLTALDVEETLNDLTRASGSLQKSVRLAPRTARTVHAVLRQALSSAQERGYVARNVARQVPLRRIPEAQRTVIDPALAKRILKAVEGDRYEAAFALAMLGLRQGEILGLAWEDVNLGQMDLAETGRLSGGRIAGQHRHPERSGGPGEDHSIRRMDGGIRLGDGASLTIRHQLVGSGPKAIRAPLKTRGSAGVVPLPPFVAERLIAHRDAQRKERPVTSLDGGLVFVTQRGYAVPGAWLTRHFQELLAKAGLPRMTLHNLRHGAASLLLGEGVHPKVAQELLRHASARLTMDLYSHVTPGQRQEAVDALERAIGGEA